MAEIAGAVARRHSAEQHVSFLERLFLERIWLLRGCAGGQCVPLHVKLGSRDQLGELVSLVEVRGFLDLGTRSAGMGTPVL